MQEWQEASSFLNYRIGEKYENVQYIAYQLEYFYYVQGKDKWALKDEEDWELVRWNDNVKYFLLSLL